MYSGCGLILLDILMFTGNFAETRKIKRPASHLIRHSIVQPFVHHGQTKQGLISTKDVNGKHHSEIQLMVPVNGEQYFLDLQLNKDLLTREHALQYQKEGQIVQNIPKIEEFDLCFYTGRVRGNPDSLVAVSTCQGVRGVIHDGQTMRYIEPGQGPEIQSSHYLYEFKNFYTSYTVRRHGYGRDNQVRLEVIRSYEKDLKESQAVRNKRDTSEQIHEPYNANNESRYVELVIVVDNAEFRANGKKLQTVHSKVFQIANIVNALLSQLNIYVALVGVVVWNEHDEIVVDRNSTITLERFVGYRKRKLALQMPNDVAFLLTKQKFDEFVSGETYVGKICTIEWSGGIATTEYEANPSDIAATVAHELGHNLGFDHDSKDCECPKGPFACIMNSTVNRNMPLPVHWSTCSSLSLTNTYQHDFDYCLRNKPTTLFNSPNCGNGFIDPGEQCDCGTDAGIGSINLCHECCHADTCTLRSNATCGAGACCDITTCNLTNSSTSD